MRLGVLSLVLAGVTTAAACAHAPPAGTIRYRNEPPVWRVDDRVPFAPKPAERTYRRMLYHTDGFVVRRITRALELRPPTRATDINSLGEVPDSTWFTNRIGVRDLSIEDVTRGPNTEPSPFARLPWTIKSAKVGGTAIGFVIEDAGGERYLVKFDAREHPELDTGAHMIVHRILWASGYNVPEDYLGTIRREDLRLAPDAVRRDALGGKVPLTKVDLDAALALVHSTNGRYRALASRFIPGTPIGPYAREGTRPDDPNDVIPHEQRRSLRGQYPIFAWLGHTDIQEDQSLDTFVPTGPTDKRGYVVHYVLDFGRALGVMARVNHMATSGYTYRFDPGYALRNLIGFGLFERPWDSLEQPPLRGIGLFTASQYDPGAWRPNSPYWPLHDKDRFDAYWGAKLLIRFSREQLAAIIAQARYSDPRAARYMLDTLVARQRATARYWFRRVAPLEAFELQGDALCFDDLALAYRLDRVTGTTHYAVDTYDYAGTQLAPPIAVTANVGGRTCTPRLRWAGSRDGYTIVRLRVVHGGRTLPPVLVHLARGELGMRVVGIRRE